MVPWRSSLHTESSFLIGANAINAAFGFLFWTAAARLYRPQDVGLAASAVAIVGLLAMLSGLGLDYALVRFLPGAARPREIINSCLTIGLAVALLAALTFLAGIRLWAPAMMPVRANPAYALILIVAAVSATLVGFMAAAYLSRKSARLVFGQSLVFGTVKVVAVLLFAVAGAGAVGLLGAWTVGLSAAVCVGLLSFLPFVEGTGFRFRPALAREVVNDMAHFASANYVSAVLWSAPMSLLPILVTNVAGAEANAYFYVATSVSGLLAMIPMAASMSLFAHGSRDATDLFRRALESTRFSLLLLAPGVVGFFLLGGRVLLLFGKAYSEAGTRLLWILALSAVPLTINYLYFGVRRVQQRMAGVVAGAVWVLIVTLGLSVVLLPKVGLLGAGIAWFAAQASLAGVVLVGFAVNR
jgi:O-antigen/teichoic acid export membrane protein